MEQNLTEDMANIQTFVVYPATARPREAEKRPFFSGPDTKALPPPFELSVHNIFRILFSRASKKVFFLSGKSLQPPPLLLAGPLKKGFFAASLITCKIS